MFFAEDTLVAKKISRPPSDYFRYIYYDAVLYDEAALAACVSLAGPDKVLFGTDFPMPNDIPKLYGIIDSRPDEESTAIKGGNAVRLLDL